MGFLDNTIYLIKIKVLFFAGNMLLWSVGIGNYVKNLKDCSFKY